MAASPEVLAARGRAWYFVICSQCMWCASAAKSHFVGSCPRCDRRDLSRMDVYSS
ncbi:MAG: hypothetical protein ACREAY_06045 [Nitrososphaera sp.]|uniref:hypothetical protein n=1 Tax=Nitrososphaera sp. TaxID=1971748 RepID=UPI003D6ECDC3